MNQTQHMKLTDFQKLLKQNISTNLSSSYLASGDVGPYFFDAARAASIASADVSALRAEEEVVPPNLCTFVTGANALELATRMERIKYFMIGLNNVLLRVV